jgi:hypothetical protein
MIQSDELPPEQATTGSCRVDTSADLERRVGSLWESAGFLHLGRQFHFKFVVTHLH